MSDELTGCSCITCSDEALELTVIALNAELELATCVDADGLISEVDLGLLGAVELGTLLLVHAGAAIAVPPPGAGAAPGSAAPARHPQAQR